MKLSSVLIAGAMAAAMPFAAAAQATISLDSPTVGWMKVPSSTEFTAIAVPWLGVDGTDVKVADLVKTDTLSAGDALYMYDKTEKKYLMWTLTETGGVKQWTAATTVADGEPLVANNSGDATIGFGKALFLKRAKVNGAYPDIYLYGRLAADSAVAAVQVEGGTAENGCHNLLASPKHTAFNPNAQGAIVGRNTGDMIIVPDKDNGGATIVEWVDETGWATKKETRVDGGPFPIITSTVEAVNAIPAGTGFWYVSRGSGTTINW